MATGKISYPSVFVVDSPTRPPPLPPKPGYRQRQKRIQTLLVILVILALCGMTIEACFIYRLYSTKEQPTTPNEPQTAMRKQGKDHLIGKHKHLGEMKPSKPMAQLTTGNSTVNGVVLWNEHQESILHQVKLKPAEGKLVMEKEGYYSVYSKIHFREDKITCTHSVLRTTDRYGAEILLLQSSRFHLKLQRPGIIDNSFLSGMFHLYKGDAVFVRVKNCSLVLSNAAEIYFGVFMV
ncbi:tumor necrosis factor ligand superfamily member 14 isoform X2 [Rhinichthys klamathensis goyatoka]|uniref:tumor necrosis factor ligand superfamily member 14 isoform X2 n=1 Tax=Rhinichthys klamathensis goyatoka TaxID=3034132 RepID=UPI0024B4C437|nr:tumor necrosis factor ligand superfamily member 14 isoform X2 [Rhinichthys klamathensis goyatoka]